MYEQASDFSFHALLIVAHVFLLYRVQAAFDNSRSFFDQIIAESIC